MENRRPNLNRSLPILPKFIVLISLLFVVLRIVDAIGWKSVWILAPIWGWFAFYLIYHFCVLLFLSLNPEFFNWYFYAVRALEEVLEQVRKSYQDLKEKHQEVSEAYDDLKNNFDDVSCEKDELQQENETLKRENETLKQENEAFKRQNGEGVASE